MKEIASEQLVLLNTLYGNLIALQNPNINKFHLSIIYEKIRKSQISTKVYWEVIKPFWKLFYSIKYRIFRYLYA